MTTTNRLIHRDTKRVKQLSREIGALEVGMSIPIVAVYLYGSWGSEYERTNSNIDLAVLAQAPLMNWQVSMRTFASKLDRDFGG